MKRVSLADVAGQLQVSKTLVSLVLNDKGDQHGISKATQQRVLAKASEMNYFPNQMARGLRIGRSGAIGLIVADIANPFYANIARKIEDETHKAGYSLIICSSDEKDEKELRLLKMLRDRQVDGIIVSSTLHKPYALQDLKRLAYPIVLIDRAIPKLEVPTVLVDNFEGAYRLTRHLIDQGYRRIVFLSVTPNYLSTIRDRNLGYRRALRDACIQVSRQWVIDVPFDDVAGTIDRMLPGVLRMPNGPTAVFTSNNNLAVAALETLKKNHFTIPGEVAFCSFDDIDLFRFCDPPVTACAQPSEEIAVNAVRLLVDAIENSKPGLTAENLVLPTQLRIRKSTQPDDNL